MARIPSVATLTVEGYRALESEDSFQAWVIDMARLNGWRVIHFRPVLTVTKDGRARYMTPIQGDAGFVDLVLARNGVVLCAELKSERGTLETPQKAWRDAIGDQWRCWRPSDRPEIEMVLQ